MEYQRVLLTGVAGFICSNLAIYLVRKYPQTRFLGIDKLSYCSSLRNIEEISTCPNYSFQQADFTQLDVIEQIFSSFNPDLVLHLGAYSHVDLSISNSITFTINNVLGTHVLLECARKYPVKLFLHMSTDEVYGSKSTISCENSTLDPTNPYSASKAAAEQLVRGYHHSFKLPIIIVRGNNVYGPRQFPEKVIPRFILRLEKKLPLQIQGSGLQCRSFIYIDDMIDALELIFFKGKIGEIYNIGSRDEISVRQLASKLSKIYGVPDRIEYVTDRCFNDHRYLIESTLLHTLGFVQKINFEDGLRRTIKWYREHLDFWTPEQLALAEK